MRILTIETSTPSESVAVVERDRILAERWSTAGRGHAEELVGAVASILEDAGTRLDELDAIAVSIGPGRFTGLRVGLATAKGLAAASGIGVRPVRTLRALALSSGVEAGLVCPVIDARRGEVYAALFRAGAPAAVMDEVALEPAALADRLRDLASREPVTFVGTGVRAYGCELGELLGPGALLASDGPLTPTPRALAALALEAPALSRRELVALEPVYLRGV